MRNDTREDTQTDNLTHAHIRTTGVLPRRRQDDQARRPQGRPQQQAQDVQDAAVRGFNCVETGWEAGTRKMLIPYLDTVCAAAVRTLPNCSGFTVKFNQNK